MKKKKTHTHTHFYLYRDLSRMKGIHLGSLYLGIWWETMDPVDLLRALHYEHGVYMLCILS